MASKQPSSSESNKAARIAPFSTRHHHKNLSLLLSRSPWNAHFSEKESGRAVGESGQIPEQSAGEREGPLLSSPLSPWLAWFGPQMRPFSCRRHHSIYSACICLLLRRPSLSFACPLSPLPVPRSTSPRASTTSSLQHPFLPLFPPSLGPSLPSLTSPPLFWLSRSPFYATPAAADQPSAWNRSLRWGIYSCGVFHAFFCSLSG